MRKRRATSLLVTLSLGLMAGILSCDTESNIEDPDLSYFVKYYGGDGDQSGVDMLALNDGTLILLGNSIHSNADPDNAADTRDIYLARINSDGDILWEKMFHDDISIATDLEPTADGNFVVLADYRETPGGLSKIKILKVSPDGVMLDSAKNTFGTLANDFSRSISLLEDGGFMIAGSTDLPLLTANPSDPDPDPSDFLNFRFDQNLEVYTPWSPPSLGYGEQLDVAVKVAHKPHVDGFPDGFYVFGYSNTVSEDNPDGNLGLFYFFREISGTRGTAKFPGNYIVGSDTEIHFVGHVAPPLDDGFIFVGTTEGTGGPQIFVARSRRSFTFNKANDFPNMYKTIGLATTNVRGVSATTSVTGNMGFIVLGNEIRSTGASNIWVSKITQDASVNWSSSFGSEAFEDSAAAVHELPDGRILIFGTMGLADNQSKMALIKVNANGQLLK
jgi:hypothetical protein